MTYTPTPEAIEAVEAELDLRGEYSNNRQVAELALTTGAPFIAAQTKVEVLREAADEFGSWGPTGIAAANALRARAATIEGKSE